MSETKARRAEAFDAIRKYLEAGETGNWKSMQDRFPDIPRASFFRIVKRVRQFLAGDATVAKSRQQIADYLESKVAKDSDQSPVGDENWSDQVPIPSVASGFRKLDMLGQFGRLLEDIDMLRQYALNDSCRIKYPAFFAQAICLRERCVGTIIKASEAIWNLQRQWDFYDLIVARVAEVSPEAARAILDRLAELGPMNLPPMQASPTRSVAV